MAAGHRKDLGARKPQRGNSCINGLLLIFPPKARSSQVKNLSYAFLPPSLQTVLSCFPSPSCSLVMELCFCFSWCCLIQSFVALAKCGCKRPTVGIRLRDGNRVRSTFCLFPAFYPAWVMPPPNVDASMHIASYCNESSKCFSLVKDGRKL